ncbi:MAG: site-2 protease family protein [Crenarchaeota archaeon]|nr:site-2 protease family protein [Thermoproteota archaeon]
MSPAALTLLILLSLSVLPYFSQTLRRKLYVPFPGFVAVRFPVKGKPVYQESLTVKLFLDGTIVIMIILMVMGYTILIQTLVPRAGGGAAFVPLIPGVTIPLELLLSLLWIIAISVALHELFHYLASIWQGIRVKSAGVGLLFVFPVAFVEPDEQALLSAPARVRARIYSAGPAANAVLAALAILLVMNLVDKGIYVIKVEPGSPAWEAGIKPGDVILSVNGKEVKNLAELREAIASSPVLKIVLLRDGERVVVTVNKGDAELIGIYVLPWVPKGPLASLPPDVALSTVQSLFWLQGINMGLAIINALPMIITDGGKLVMELKTRRGLAWVSDALQVFTIVLFLQALVKSIV